MANLPEGTSTLGPVYLPTEMKKKYMDVCEIEKILMSDGIKEDVMKRIKKHFPDFEVKV